MIFLIDRYLLWNSTKSAVTSSILLKISNIKLSNGFKKLKSVEWKINSKIKIQLTEMEESGQLLESAKGHTSFQFQKSLSIRKISFKKLKQFIIWEQILFDFRCNGMKAAKTEATVFLLAEGTSGQLKLRKCRNVFQLPTFWSSWSQTGISNQH